MIPILFPKTETQFLSNGVGRLADCLSCEVTEERNGVYECEFKYPITGKWYQYIVENGGIIYATHDDTKIPQPFDIYKQSAPINGIVTFNARHISYRLLGITVEPFTASSCLTALEGIGTHSMQTNPFSFWTDKSVAAAFTLPAPASARSILAGNQGSILDVYGKGEYEFDKFTVKLHTNRGTNSGVSIRYGKNLSDMTNVMDAGQVFNAVAPFWKGEDGELVMLPEKYIVAAGTTGEICVPLDLTTEFSEKPTQADLRARAERYFSDNEPWLPDNNITVDFIQLWQTDEYKDYAPLQRVSLCDTVSIYFPALGVAHASAKVIKTVHDTLREKYVKMELGKPQTTLQEAILRPMEKDLESMEAMAMQKVSNSQLEAAILAATQLITGVDGGHVVIKQDENSGEPQEILIMDTDDKQTAVNVWRWNLNGLGHSHSGYNGPYNDIAITMDGKINASMILTGYLVANIIKGGTLTLGGDNNEDGIWIVNDANGDEVARGDKDGVTSKSLKATDYIYLNGGAGSFLNIPLSETNPNDEYLKLQPDFAYPFMIRRQDPLSMGNYYRVCSSGRGLTIDVENQPGSVTQLFPNYIQLGDQNHNVKQATITRDGIVLRNASGGIRARMLDTLIDCSPGDSRIYLIELNSNGVAISDENNSLFAKMGKSYWTGEPELQLVGQNGQGDIILSPGEGIRIGNTTLNETQLQQLLALI